MYGPVYNNGLARGLDCELNENGTVIVDEHGRTSVERVCAVGDMAPGHNQIPVALGDGDLAVLPCVYGVWNGGHSLRIIRRFE